MFIQTADFWFTNTIALERQRNQRYIHAHVLIDWGMFDILVPRMWAGSS